jgi:hypothetical protein
MLKGKCIIMPTGERKQSGCGSGSDLAYQAFPAHLRLPFVILFFWGILSLARSIKRYYKKKLVK